MEIRELFIENVRCFSGPHTIEIKPITILIGKNSTGKTTLLATLAAVSAGRPLLFKPNFNIGPFNLGSFDNIVTNKGRKEGKEKYIKLGVLGALDKTEFVYLAEYKKHTKELGLVLNKATLNTKKARMDFERKHKITYEADLILDRKEEPLFKEINWGTLKQIEKRALIKFTSTSSMPIEVFERMTPDILFYPLIMERTNDKKPKQKSTEKKEAEKEEVKKILRESLPIFDFSLEFPDLAQGNLHIAPIRSKPERTYETYKKVITAEGTHIPFLIEVDSRTRRRELIKALNEFGKASGLYKLLDVKQLGSPSGNRFELLIKINGPGRNIVDVGYGVSQALPVVVESLKCPDGAIMTLQQPEVHLHPEAQAALGTLIVNLAREGKKTFVLETHSDFIVDRIRIEISKGSIRAEDVSILFLELKHNATKINKLRLDEKGNIIRPTASYRDFFLKEAHALLKK